MKSEAKTGSSSKEGDQRSLDSGVLRRLLGLAWKYKTGLILPFIIQICLLSLGVAGLSLTGIGLDAIVHAVDPSKPAPKFPLGLFQAVDPSAPGPEFPLGHQAHHSWTVMQQVLAICVAIIGFSILRGILNLSNAVAISKLIQGRLVVDLRAAIYDKLQRLSFHFYDNNETGSIINRVTGDVQTVSGFINGIVLQCIMLTLSLVVYLLYMIRISPRLTLACLATTPILWYGSLLFSRMMKAAYRKNRELFDRIILVLSENLQGIHVVKGFGLQQQQYDRFKQANRAFKDQQQWIFWRNSIFGPSITYLTQINLAILLGYGGWMVIHGQLEMGGGLWVFIGLLGNVSGQVQGLANLTNSVQQSLVAARRVYEVLDAPLEIQSPPNAKRLPRANGKLEFRNVSFEFQPGKPVLKDISFVVQPGQHLGILGPTGAGKSVLLNLICRFYDVTSGQVLVDDVDIREYNLYDLRKSMGLVFQESFLFSHTVATNIAFGNPNATRQQIEAAANTAKAHQFIVGMPKGYDTLLSEGGNNLSGGQRQRLAMARALLLQPSFLLMDDPMAAVDAQTEHEMSEAIESVMAGRTTILVANRISTLRRADLILVMQKGKIIQRGTHDELMALPGHYHETARLQIDEEAKKAASLLGVTV